MINLINFKINLQLFAEEKTEPATGKRRQEARDKGQVVKSRELVTAVVLMVTFWAIYIFSKSIYTDLLNLTKKYLSLQINFEEAFRVENLMHLLISNMAVFAKIMLPILGVAALAAFLSNYIQVGFLFTLKPMVPNLNKINPIEGFKRLFSKQALVDLFKSIFKISVIGYFVYDYLKKNYVLIPDLIGMDLGLTAKFVGNTIYNIGLRAGFVLLILSLFDYFFQHMEYEKSLKMSKKEIQDEYKQTEGNPQVKSKIREKQRQIAMRRMMSEVPKSDVIITNPTHYAIAIKYDSSLSDAPLVLAKGKDLIAQRIKEKAKESKVPIVENRPLAQALYASVEIGGKVPTELYKAVAEVLAFVYSLKNK